MQLRNGWCVLQPVAGLCRDLSSPGLGAGGDEEDLRHFPARGRGEPAGRLGRRRLPAAGAALASTVCAGDFTGWKIKRDAKLGKGRKSVWSNCDTTRGAQ